MENKADIRDRGNENGFKQVCPCSLPGILLLCTFNDVVFLFLFHLKLISSVLSGLVICLFCSFGSTIVFAEISQGISLSLDPKLSHLHSTDCLTLSISPDNPP